MAQENKNKPKLPEKEVKKISQIHILPFSKEPLLK